MDVLTMAHVLIAVETTGLLIVEYFDVTNVVNMISNV